MMESRPIDAGDLKIATLFVCIALWYVYWYLSDIRDELKKMRKGDKK